MHIKQGISDALSEKRRRIWSSSDHFTQRCGWHRNDGDFLTNFHTYGEHIFDGEASVRGLLFSSDNILILLTGGPLFISTFSTQKSLILQYILHEDGSNFGRCTFGAVAWKAKYVGEGLPLDHECLPLCHFWHKKKKIAKKIWLIRYIWTKLCWGFVFEKEKSQV